MTATVKRILEQCKARGIILEPTPDGEHLDLHYQEPPPEELRQLLRAYKQEIISLLRPQTSLWHAQTIARAVQREGLCLFWSDVLNEAIAFTNDDTFRKSIPAGVVVYTLGELWELFQDKPKISPETLRLIHASKKADGQVQAYGANEGE